MANPFRRPSNPTPRNITVKYSAPCASCGATIKVGELATYYPAGSIRDRAEATLCHMGGLEGNSQKCADNMRAKLVAQADDRMVADYVSAGLGEC